MRKALKKPVVVFVFAKNRGDMSTRFGGFVRRLQKAGHLENMHVRTVALEDLTFVISSEQQASIYDAASNLVFDDASLVYFKSWESDIERAAATAHYLAAKGIPFIDSVVGDMGVSKLSQLFRLWRHGIPVTPFISLGQRSSVLDSNVLGSPEKYIVKPAHGQKGKGVQLLNSFEMALAACQDSADSLLQPYIENDGDYRVLTYGFKVRGALYRQAAAGSFVNNTSAGASSTFIQGAAVPEEVARMAVLAAKATHHAIAGIDIIINQKNNEALVLEVNQGSQIVTGQWVGEKMEAFSRSIEELLQNRYPRDKNKLDVIGRHIRVDLPEFGMNGVLGKVDTGAYQSALHVESVREEEGELIVILPNIVDGQYDGIHELRTRDFDVVQVTNTSGRPENRFRVKTLVNIAGKEYRTPVTLTHRGGMKSPMLLGRRLLRGRFLVNPELSRRAYEEST